MTSSLAALLLTKKSFVQSFQIDSICLPLHIVLENTGSIKCKCLSVASINLTLKRLWIPFLTTFHIFSPHHFIFLRVQLAQFLNFQTCPCFPRSNHLRSALVSGNRVFLLYQELLLHKQLSRGFFPFSIRSNQTLQFSVLASACKK